MANTPVFYIWEPRFTFDAAPVSAYSWEFSPTTFGMENYKHFGLVKLTHVSSQDLSLVFIVDGTTQTAITVANSIGAYRQDIFRVPVMKGKLYIVRLISEGEFRLDPRDSSFQVKKWGADGPYEEMRVFGNFAMIEG